MFQTAVQSQPVEVIEEEKLDLKTRHKSRKHNENFKDIEDTKANVCSEPGLGHLIAKAPPTPALDSTVLGSKPLPPIVEAPRPIEEMPHNRSTINVVNHFPISINDDFMLHKPQPKTL